MIYNVAALLGKEVGATRVYRLDDEVIPAPESNFYGVSGIVKLTRTDRGILFHAEAAGALAAECARCLEPAVIELRTVVDEEFFPTNFDIGGGSSLLRQQIVEEEDAPEFWIDEANDLDAREPIRQGFVSETPLVSLCRPDCAGICPQCGSDRNSDPCECDRTAVDPRLAALLDIKL